MIEGHVAGLGRALIGRRRAKADLLGEAQAGLHDAVDALLAQGVDAPTSAARAIGDFGSIREVAPAFQRELALSDLARSARLIVAVLLLQAVLWARVATSGGAGDLFLRLDGVVGLVAAAAVVLALAVLLGCGIGLRYVDLNGRVLRASGAAALAACVLFAALGLAMWLASGGDGSTLLWLMCNLLAPLGIVAAGARRCLAAR